VIAEALTPEAFEPFGMVVGRPAAPADASAPGWSWWAHAGGLPAEERPYAIGYLALEPAEPAFDWAERHERSVEMIAPLGAECLVYVAAPGPEPESFRVFRVQPGQAVVLDRGVWHGAPLAPREPTAALVLLLEGTGAQDTVVHTFSDKPIRIED
jgi:ureidoglycolate lyase